MNESTILNNLNQEQYLPASICDGAILVTAGAGSGKTRMLTHRIAHMLNDLEIKPYNILAITFTNKAANEMKERVEKMVGDIDGMWICTFHAMCSKILRSNINLLGFTSSFSIYGDTEKNRVIKRVVAERGTDINAETFAWHISNAKNNLLSPEAYSKFIHDKKKCEIITAIYSEYEKELAKANALDFDDLLVKTYVLLRKFPEVLEHYQNKFKYIFVDEFQDTNTAQYELVKLLADKNKNICAVGDEDQCIYSWRGAQVGNVKQFTKDFENCKIFKLEQNYRSTKKIVELANKLIKNNASRIDKNLWTNNSDGSDVILKQAYNDIEEAEFIAEKIEYLVTNQGYKYSDFAILMRVNSLSRLLEEKLLTYNIPYKVYGGFKFFERKEIKDTTAYLYLVANPNDTEATTRMLGFPKKGIGDVSIAEINEISKQNGVSLMQVIMNASSYNISGGLLNKLNNVRDLFNDLNTKKDTMQLEEFVKYLVQRVGIKEAIGTKTEEDENKCLNVDDLIKSVAEFSDSNEGASIDEFLQSITLMRDIDSMQDEDNFVSLITIHAAKGLEFYSVFVVGLNDGLFPLSRAINSGDPNELEEERRLMYVAVTRAKNNLYLTRPKIKFNFESRRTEYTIMSRFLPEMFDELKKQNTNSLPQRNSLSQESLSNFLEQSYSSSSLDQKMSTHANIVNVSGNNNLYGSKNNSNQTQTLSASDFAKFKKGTRVSHHHFGEGTITLGVTDFTSAFVTINFDKVGIKTLSLKYAKLEIIKN